MLCTPSERGMLHTLEAGYCDLGTCDDSIMKEETSSDWKFVDVMLAEPGMY